MSRAQDIAIHTKFLGLEFYSHERHDFPDPDTTDEIEYGDVHRGVICRVCGDMWTFCCADEPDDRCEPYVPRYATDMAMAWRIAEKAATEDWNFDLLYRPGSGVWTAYIVDGETHEGVDESAPMAIVKAALKMIEDVGTLPNGELP